MAHHHGQLHHIVPRQRQRQDEDEEQGGNDGVATVVSVVIKTMPKTFSGDAVWVTAQPQTLIAPAVRTSSQDDRDPPSSKAASSSPTSTRRAQSSTKSESDESTKATSSPKNTATTLMVATSSPTVASSVIAALTGVSTPSSTASATAAAAASSGMSGGAKAGLALGILLAVGAILGAVLFLYHRKKKQVALQKVDNEKVAMQNAPPPPPPVVQDRAPSIRTQRTMSTAPRLSLRPVTQFSPTFAENGKSGGGLLSVAPAASTSPSNERTLSTERPSSSWERPGAAHTAVSPQNPFHDPVSQSDVPPQNPFGNNAALDSSLSLASSAAPSMDYSPLPSLPVTDFANPAPAIAAAEASPTGMAAALSAVAPISRKEVPAPPKIMADMVPPSPAWTEDIPASPGPAPVGPPPAGPPASAPNNVHRVQLDFKPSMGDELELRAGQLVRMLHEYDDGWALCVRMDRTQQGVVPRTCLSKHPVKPRTAPPRQGPPGPRMRGPPIASPMGPGGVPHPHPLTPSGRSSPHPPTLSPAHGRSMNPGPGPGARARSNSNAPYAGPPRSMSPGPYGGGPQQRQMQPPQMGRPRSNSASQAMAKRASPPGPSPMNPNAIPNMSIPARKPVPGQAI